MYLYTIESKLFSNVIKLCYQFFLTYFSCRAFEIPFYVGVIVPFILIYIFNWSVFVIIFVNLIYKAKRSDTNKMKDNKKKMEFKQQFIIAITLSILFGLSWGIGLPATQQLQDTIVVRDIFASLFVIFTSFQGFLIFFMHCLRSPEIRKNWMKWFKITTRQDHSEVSTSAALRAKKSSSKTDSTTGDKHSAKYRFIKKKQDSTRSTSAGDEFSFISESDNAMSTLQRNVAKSGITDKDSTLVRFGQGSGVPNIDYLPFIEENEQEEGEESKRSCTNSEKNSDSDVWDDHQQAAVFALPEGVIGNEDFDIDVQSVGRLSLISTKGNTVFMNPMEMYEFEPDLFGDTISVSSVYSQNDTSQTVFVNPMQEDTV